MALADLAAGNLRVLGYRVLQAGDAQQALAVLEENHGIDLLFTDIILPGPMDGYKLAAEAGKRWPNLRILATSGFSKQREKANHSGGEDSQQLARNLLNKPYSRTELATAVHRALKAPRG
jgi:CheY-like chemotaxis protein